MMVTELVLSAVVVIVAVSFLVFMLGGRSS